MYGRQGSDFLMRGFLKMPTQTVDNHITVELTNKLFTMDPPDAPGLDLAAINIQRGRDHGLPGHYIILLCLIFYIP